MVFRTLFDSAVKRQITLSSYSPEYHDQFRKSVHLTSSINEEHARYYQLGMDVDQCNNDSRLLRNPNGITR